MWYSLRSSDPTIRWRMSMSVSRASSGDQFSDPIPAVKRDVLFARSDRLFHAALHWLRALENFHHLGDADPRQPTPTGCSAGRASHPNTINFRSTHDRITHVLIAAPRKRYPDRLLSLRVVRPLGGKGYDVPELQLLSCGCYIFEVWPQHLA